MSTGTESTHRRIVILTGCEPRHSFLRIALGNSPMIEVQRSYCEGLEQSLKVQVQRDSGSSDLRRAHLVARELSEQDFFGAFNALARDHSRPVFLEKGQINDPEHVGGIEMLRADLLVAYGCSLIKSSLVSSFAGRFLNLHLGLSPYYRGSGTNFWPLVNGEPEFVGATFMHLDAGIDTGRVIHQIRARVFPDDSPHQIGNRLIADSVRVYRQLVENFDAVALHEVPVLQTPSRLYRRRDFTPAATEQLYANFRAGMVATYLRDRDQRDSRVPIVQHPALMKCLDS